MADAIGVNAPTRMNSLNILPVRIQNIPTTGFKLGPDQLEFNIPADVVTAGTHPLPLSSSSGFIVNNPYTFAPFGINAPVFFTASTTFAPPSSGWNTISGSAIPSAVNGAITVPISYNARDTIIYSQAYTPSKSQYTPIRLIRLSLHTEIIDDIFYWEIRNHSEDRITQSETIAALNITITFSMAIS